ncbi:MAG: DUF167 domain-containing protein [Methyloligellaceae bacterium]
MPESPQVALPARQVRDGIVVSVRLTPKSSRDAVEGAAAHGDKAVLKARVRAVPEKGRANAALEQLLAQWLGVSRSHVTLTSGSSGRLKTVHISGEPKALLASLRERVESLAGQAKERR